ncbi:MAG: class I SAM-dependent RNA methyltransferase [Hyphomicrobiales bacterium]|nr:class I SAM-dependent RNA methyltransferase [Hyphomicrobiales bacterium]
MTEPLEQVSIVALDAHGAGVAANGAIIPGALPGERALIKLDGKRAELLETLHASPDRANPICPWFGKCGGCAVQHMSPSLYHAWKRGLVVEALEREGVATKVEELVDAHGAGRRRATFHARFPHGQPDEVGFMRARSHDIIAIDACPLFSASMAGAIPAARALSRDLRGLMKPLDIAVSATLDGLDVDLRGSGPLGRYEAQKLTRTAQALDLARVSNHGETLIERRPPRVAFGEALAKLPPGGFLQATEAGEAWLAQFAERALADTKRVADLFCGAGAFALRLARRHEVFAADADRAAIAALSRAGAATPGLRKLEAETRDLFRRPLQGQELAAFDAALIDPPRAGAIEQARALAASTLPLVVSISCNAETFARDARILVDSGFQVESVTPLDQFRFSAHVEIAAVFRRPKPKTRARRLL